jgi:hypothetical protein
MKTSSRNDGRTSKCTAYHIEAIASKSSWNLDHFPMMGWANTFRIFVFFRPARKTTRIHFAQIKSAIPDIVNWQIWGSTPGLPDPKNSEITARQTFQIQFLWRGAFDLQNVNKSSIIDTSDCLASHHRTKMQQDYSDRD